MAIPPCQCHQCRRRQKLQAKLDRARQILEGGEGALSISYYNEMGIPTNDVIPAEDKEGLREAISVLENDVELAAMKARRYGHRRARRRTRSSLLRR